MENVALSEPLNYSSDSATWNLEYSDWTRAKVEGTNVPEISSH